jgi:hypothetical protein
MDKMVIRYQQGHSKLEVSVTWRNKAIGKKKKGFEESNPGQRGEVQSDSLSQRTAMATVLDQISRVPTTYICTKKMSKCGQW